MSDTARVYGSIPGSPQKSCAKRDRRLLGKLSATSGCNIPYPSVTRFLFPS